MTRNEKVAAKLGLKLHLDNKWQLYIHEITAYLDDFGTDTPSGHWLAHLLIERMRQDGWHVHASFISDQQVHLGAFDTKLQKWEFADKPDFPAAVVELFVKVYAIPDGE